MLKVYFQADYWICTKRFGQRNRFKICINNVRQRHRIQDTVDIADITCDFQRTILKDIGKIFLIRLGVILSLSTVNP